MKRVLTARFMHETNTFSRVPTDMAMIRRRDYHLENEIPAAFRGTPAWGAPGPGQRGRDLLGGVGLVVATRGLPGGAPPRRRLRC